ncbi:MAG: hypothetical protein WAV26_12225 [Candidatus Deferrimicrobium sp.]
MMASILSAVHGAAVAGGPFGPPQPVSGEAGGLHTGIGYEHREDRYRDGSDFTVRQNQVFSELGYGTVNYGIYGRIGVSDLKIPGAFRSSQASVTTSGDDLKDNRKFFGALGGQGFYPFNKAFGVGAFLQGSYAFQNFTDDISGTRDGIPVTAALKVKKLWDVNFGIGAQATLFRDIKLYAGPYLYYSQAKISSSGNIPGLPFPTGEVTVHNKTNVGGFAGIDVPLARGFHLVVEGQYSERFSAGTTVAYSY